MMQNPGIAFCDPKLQQCSILKNAQNQPRPWAGAFAVVYKGMDAGGQEPFAIRVFTTESPERRERYELISSYLKDRKLRCLVDFEYRDNSIRSAGDGKWYPMITMEWVDGDTLFNWVRAVSLQGNRKALAIAAKGWVELVMELGEANVSHGDLQHANVMVTTAGELKLVDYDCMCVPSLIGRRNLEIGVQPYQHPDRDSSTLLSLDLDNFSALVIYVALRALSADPGLWQKYVEQPSYDKLLFRPEDFAVPGDSALYRDLMESPAKGVRDLTQKLFGFACVRMDQVPSLAQLTNSYAKIEQLLQKRQWAAAVKELNRRGRFHDAPKRLQPLIRQAYQYVCREQEWRKFQKLPQETSEANDRSLVGAWNESLFGGYEPAERQRVRVSEAHRRVKTLDRIGRRVRRAESGTRQGEQEVEAATLAGEQSIVEAAAKLPQGYQYDLRPRVDQARRRVSAVQRLEKALDSAASEAMIVTAWRTVLEAKCDGLADPDWRPRIELAEQRAPVLKALHEIPDDLPAYQQDQRILETWQEDLLKDCREAERWRPAYQAAVARRDVLERLQTATEEGNQEAIAELMEEPCLAEYPLPKGCDAAIKAVRDRIEQTKSLLAALDDNRRASFHELFDAGLIRQHAERFAPHESLLHEWTLSEVLPLEKLGLGPARNRKSLKGSGTKYRVRWTWPQQRFTDRCLLAVCPDKPGEKDNPQDLAAHHRVSLDRQSWQRQGRRQVLRTQPEWQGGYVVVWAVVDLGFRAFYSPPLVLGCLGAASRPKVAGLLKGLAVFSSHGREASGAEADHEQK